MSSKTLNNLLKKSETEFKINHKDITELKETFKSGNLGREQKLKGLIVTNESRINSLHKNIEKLDGIKFIDSLNTNNSSSSSTNIVNI